LDASAPTGSDATKMKANTTVHTSTRAHLSGLDHIELPTAAIFNLRQSEMEKGKKITCEKIVI
jgi:hypothetical protein